MALSLDNLRIIRVKVNEAGDSLKGHLPSNDNFAMRNPYAHMWERLRFRLGKGYKECDDSEVVNILEIIDYYKQNPE